MSVQIIECTNQDELYRHYTSQSEAQPAYIELDLKRGTLLADYDGVIGSGVPGEVWHGFERRYGIPMLTGDAANELMREIAPLADRILADWEEHWDGNNMRARLGEDAAEAEGEIERILRGYEADAQDGVADVVQEWDADGAISGSEVEEFGITADTTDSRLAEIEETIRKQLEDVSDPGAVVVLSGVDAHLKMLRDDLADEDPLTSAELQIAREASGLTGDAFAAYLDVNPRTVRSWQQGRDEVPGWVRLKVAELRESTAQAVAATVAKIESDEDFELVVYRDDEEFKAAYKAGRLSYLGHIYRRTASWHRMVCGQAAQATGARIEFADQDDE